MPERKEGDASGGIEYDPRKLKAMMRSKARTEARWAAMAGPITVRKVGDPAPTA
jgi:hypothetical protein